MTIFNALRGRSGEFEVQRVLVFVGTISYIVMAPALVWCQWIKGVSFTEFCLAYPGGLAACLGAGAGSISLKDRNVAKANVVESASPPPTGQQAVKS